MAFDRQQGERELAIDEIQGDVLVGLQKDVELFVGFDIVAAELAEFRCFLRDKLAPLITTTRQALTQEAQIRAVKHVPFAGRLQLVSVNVGFSFKGLKALGVGGVDDIKDSSFKDGLVARSAALGDPTDPTLEGAPKNWEIGGTGEEVDGLLLITGQSKTAVDNTLTLLSTLAGKSWKIVYQQLGEVRKVDRGHEHFGYQDGISQPGIRGEIDGQVGLQKFLQASQNPNDPGQGLPGADLLWPGEFVFGYPSQKTFDPKKPDDDLDAPGEDANGGISWMNNGSYLVFRRLKQFVPEFDTFVKQRAKELNTDSDLLGARLVGRWKSGAPLITTPAQDDPALAVDPLSNNDFEFGNDPDGRKCPFAAHIRKAYPRDEITPAGASASGDFARRERSEHDTQTHRFLRRGIPFGPEVTDEELDVSDGTAPTTKQDRGLLFVSYQTSLTDQFEFVQINWFNNKSFPPAGGRIPGAGFDPLLGQAAGQPRPFQGALTSFPTGTPPGPETTLPRDFVVPTGGGYFFVPSLSTLRDQFGRDAAGGPGKPKPKK